MSLKVRLSLICAFFTLAIAGLAYVGYTGSRSLASSLDSIDHTQLPAIRNMTLVDMVHDGLRAVVFRALYFSGSSNAAEKQQIAAELKEMSEEVEKYMKVLQGLKLMPETSAAITDVGPSMTKYLDLSARVTDLALSGKKAEASAELVKYQEVFKELEVKLEQLGERIEKDAGKINTDGQQTPQRVLWMSIITVVLGVLMSIWAVNNLSSNIFRAYTSIKAVSSEVHETGTELSAASQQLASASQEQASSVEETSSSLEEISGMVSSSLKSSEQSVVLSNKVSDLVKSGTDSMGELQDAVHQIADANARVEKLAKLIEEIGEKTELIDEIVFQTRLLSFNASVEAERAGEYGRGFAVVAQEVGNLAQMSGKSASEIGQIVKNSIKEAQDVVHLNRSKVELGVNLCKKTYQQLQSIEVASKEILGAAENVLRSSEEQNSGVQQINQAIQLVSQTTQENTALAVEVSSNSTRLAGQADKLSAVVGQLEAMVFGSNGAGAEVASVAKPTASSAKKHSQGRRPLASVHTLPEMKPAAPMSNGSLALKDQEDPWEKL